MPDWPLECSVQAMPLARTVKQWKWLAERIVDTMDPSRPSWALPQGGLAGDVERVCGLSPCVYLFAGYVRPRGVVAFAYTPEVERGRQGEVGSFDSGGVYTGRCQPFLGSKGSPDAIHLIQTERWPLDAWRGAFGSYIQEYFHGDCQDYLLGRPPAFARSPAWGAADLPARYEENYRERDRASWSWEIRIQERFPIGEHLLAWSCTQDTFNNLNDYLTDEGRSPPLPGWQSLLDAEPIRRDNFTDVLHETMRVWVEERCRS
ncbi:MAG: hypothetical protein H7837_06030 [Magnetococcus sp. MYC-9]